MRADLKELHLACHQAIQGFTKVATDTIEFVHGEKGDLMPLSAVAAITQPCSEITTRLGSLQGQCARDYSDEWNDVCQVSGRMYMIVGDVLIGKRQLNDVETSLNQVTSKLRVFTLKVEEKLDSI